MFACTTDLSRQAHDDFLLNFTSHSYSMCRHLLGTARVPIQIHSQAIFLYSYYRLSLNKRGFKKCPTVVLQKTLQMLFMKQHFNLDLLELIKSRIEPQDVLKGQC